ncbi:hypothetical protein BV898_02738 [Hypsibius exemplaris]|uniref:Uncharacterized protein n=1 Tax=Hypsibius exemplaris TaxID=2072580 RepID=A0A1W0X7A9_HYPEX|nr:hypothetical protein BV898_02738 [Hypsibius exemplaris]
MISQLSVLAVLLVTVSLCQADLLDVLSKPRVKRQQPSVGYGGGVSMTVALNPYDRVHPVNFANSVNFGYGVNGAGISRGNTISYGNTIGNGQANGNAFGGAGDGYGYGGGNSNTLVGAGTGYTNANTYNTGFSGSSGNGFGRGGATVTDLTHDSTHMGCVKMAPSLLRYRNEVE